MKDRRMEDRKKNENMNDRKRIATKGETNFITRGKTLNTPTVKS